MKIMYVNLGTGVCGGVRIICEHLNRLTERGHKCYMGVMSGEPVLDWMPINFTIIPPNQLDAKAKDMDILVATEANTAEPVAKMQTTAKKFYFIQMRESLFFANGDPLWAGRVEANYKRMKGILSPIVISWWLKDFLENIYGYEDVPIVPNGLNEKMFYPDPAYPKGHLPRVLIEGHTHGEAKDIKGIAKAIVDAYRKQVKPLEVWGFSQLQPSDNFAFDMFSLLPSQDDVRRIYSSCDVVVKASRFEGRSCLVGGNLICTDNGVRAIGQIATGDEVLGLDGEYHAVSKTWKRHYKGEIVRLDVVGSRAEPLLLTPDHPVMAIQTVPCQMGGNGHLTCKPTCVKQVNKKTGEKTSCSKRPYEQYEPTWIEAQDVKINDILLIPYPKTIDNEPELLVAAEDYTTIRDGFAWDYMTNQSGVAIPFSMPMSSQAMELYGLFLAEGWTSESKVEFALHKKEIHLQQKILGYMDSLFGLKGRLMAIPNENGVKLTFECSLLARTLRHYFGESAYDKHIPSQLITAPPELQWPLLYGFWQGDGSRTANGAFSMATVSPALAFDLKTLSVRCGLIPTLTKYLNKTPSIMPHGRNIVARHPMYQLRFQGPDKHRFGELADIQVNRLSKAYRRSWQEGNVVFAPVTNCALEDFDGYVYDIAVPDTQHFATVSGVVHNCIDVEAMACGTAIVRAIDKGDDDLIHGYNCLKVGYDVEHPQKFQENVNKLFNHLVAVLAEDRLRQGLVTNGLYYVKHNLRWSSFVDRLETIYGGGVPPSLPRTEHIMEDSDEG